MRDKSKEKLDDFQIKWNEKSKKVSHFRKRAML